MVFIFLQHNRLHFVVIKNLQKFYEMEDFVSYVLTGKKAEILQKFYMLQT